MPTNAQPANPIARLFRPDPSRELFRVLADSLGEVVFVLSPTADSLLACNHAFLLLTGFGRAEVESLSPGDLFPGVPGEATLAQLAAAWEGSELSLEQIALKPRQGEILLIDLTAYAVGSPRAAILVKARLSRERLEQDDRARAQGSLLQTMAEATAALLDTTSPPLPAVLNHARALLSADAIGLYRVSTTGPEYTLEGRLPEEFPTSLPSTALDPLQRPSSWSLGQRPEHPLHKAARASGLN
ncbi:MAG: PAS domain-containing protein, partial [Actinobacteria bacterium]|nr:PAS domain-containing protein [Actinomycetota bacterium]